MHITILSLACCLSIAVLLVALGGLAVLVRRWSTGSAIVLPDERSSGHDDSNDQGRTPPLPPRD